jgi:hypothetical protein
MESAVNAFLKDSIVESALDDVESLDTLKKDVASWAKEEGQPFSDDDFMAAMRSLVSEGKLRAFRLDTSTQKFEVVTAAANVPEAEFAALWFRAQRKAK